MIRNTHFKNPVFLYILATSIIISFVASNFSSCSKEEDLSENKFVACTHHFGDLIGQFLDSTWTKEKIQSFIEGRWRLHRIETEVVADSVHTGNLTLDREIRFSAQNIIELYEPYDQLLGSSKYIIAEEKVTQELQLFRLEQLTPIQGNYVTFGIVIPCASELVFYRSDVDQGDYFYRKVE